MAKKGVFKKIVTGALKVGGAVLGFATGVGVLGAVGGAVKGTGALIGAKTSIAKLGGAVNKVKEGAANLVTGKTAEQRKLILQAKQESRDLVGKLETVDRLVGLGKSVEAARAAVGLDPVELTNYEGETVNKSSMFDFLQNKTVMYIGAALVGMFLLSKLKRR